MSEKIVQLNKEVIKGQIKELVRGSVEATLNELLEKEAESLTQAARHERSKARQGYRSGHYDRNLTTTSVTSRSICPGPRGPHRDVPGRRFRAPCGGHHRGPVGQQGFARYHQRAEQESLRSHRGLT